MYIYIYIYIYLCIYLTEAQGDVSPKDQRFRVRYKTKSVVHN
jgi:hypothetical protein